MKRKNEQASLHLPEPGEERKLEGPIDLSDNKEIIVAEIIELAAIIDDSRLTNMRVAILSEDGFEQSELERPRAALEQAGATVEILSSESGMITGWDKHDWGMEIAVDKLVHEAVTSDYDALVLPGGVMNPDKLRMNKDAVRFVSDFIRSGKPVAAICHGPQTLIETGLIAGRTMTSYPSLQTDLRNAGVHWVDSDVVQDGQFITSRRPADLNAFNAALIDALRR